MLRCGGLLLRPARRMCDTARLKTTLQHSSIAMLGHKFSLCDPVRISPPSSPHRHFWSNATGKKDPYEVLGVTRSATPQEIKLAYFREAKKCHPDMNPGDKNATKRFQELSSAYEEIKNPSKQGYTGGYRAATQEEAQKEAEATFNDVWDDIEVVKEAISTIGRDVQDEVEMVLTAARAGDWKTVWESANENKGFIVGVLLPLAVVLRFPAAVFLALRAAGAVVPWVIVPLVRTGHAAAVTRMLWKRIVTEARAKSAMSKATGGRRKRR